MEAILVGYEWDKSAIDPNLWIKNQYFKKEFSFVVGKNWKKMTEIERGNRAFIFIVQ